MLIFPNFLPGSSTLRSSFTGLCSSSVRLSAPSGDAAGRCNPHSRIPNLRRFILMQKQLGHRPRQALLLLQDPDVYEVRGKTMPYSLVHKASACAPPSSPGLVLHDEPTQPFSGADGTESHWRVSSSRSVRQQFGQALADQATAAPAVLAFQNLAPLLHRHAHSKGAALTEIKFRASTWNKYTNSCASRVRRSTQR